MNGSPRILVVEDEEIIRKSLCEFLTEEGFEVAPASSVESARRLCHEYETNETNFDVAICDVQLPDGDLYVVNYDTDDAPRAQIRGYVVGREDWFLFPEGALDNNPPFDREGKYYEAGQEKARAQQAWVDEQDWRRRVPTQK